MKKLMNLVKDGVLVTIVTSSLAGAPKITKDIDSKLSYNNNRSVDAFKPKYSLFIDRANSRAISYYELKKIIDKAYSEIEVPDYLTPAVQMARSYVESTNIPHATSHVGARGLHQIMEGAWNDAMHTNFDNAYDPLLNNIASLKHLNNVDIYLRENYAGFEDLPLKQKIDLSNAAYNGGQGTLKRLGWDIDKMSKETRDYVQKMRDRIQMEQIRLYEMYNNDMMSQMYPRRQIKNNF